MRSIYRSISLILFLILLSSLNAGSIAPLAPVSPDTLFIHNTTLVDNWSWLRDRSDRRLADVLKSEDLYTTQQMKPSRKLAGKLYKEYLGFDPKHYKSHPYLLDGYKYYSRQSNRQPYSVHYRIKDVPGAKEELIMDENKLGKGLDFFALGTFSISEDGRWMAYSVDSTGDENYQLFFKDLSTGKTKSTGISGLSECYWKADSRTLLITKINDRFQTDSVWSLDTISGAKTLLYKELDSAWDLGLYYNCTKELIFLLSSSKDATEAFFMPTDDSSKTWSMLIPRSTGHIYYPEFYEGNFYFQSNLHNPDFSIYTAPKRNFELSAWKTVVPGQPGSPISSYLINKSAIVVLARHAGFERLEVWDRAGAGMIYSLQQEGDYNLDFWDNHSPAADYFYYSSENEVHPYSLYRHYFSSRSDSLEYQSPVPKAINPDRYQTELRMVKTADGTSVPLRLIYAKTLDRSQPQATVLYGYGAYGDYEDPYFSSSSFPLLDRGLIYAVANIRGGGEFGKKWYDEGRLLNKKNSFTDFVACIDYLLNNGISTRDQLAIQGGSAGGLLIGAVTNLAYDKVKLAVLDVPFVDPINTMLDPSLPLTIQEYEEWGNPNVPEAFNYILSYSPYDNIKAHKYPTMLISSALNDSRVGYWEGLKYVQKLRSLNQSQDPIVFRLLKEGHTGSTNRFSRLREYADTMGFILHELGLDKKLKQ